MYNLAALKRINIEQLVTPMDRLLLSSGHVGHAPKRRSFDLSHEAALAVAASKARMQTTYIIRAQRGPRGLLDVATAAGVIVWLFVAALCLLV